jgi:O-6-methylguanine DNA methyltransferase
MPASLAIATLVTPDGPFHLAVSARGVVAAERGGDRASFEAMLGVRFHGLTEATPAAQRMFQGLLPALEAILAGDEHDVRGVPVDLADRAPFDQAVLAAVREVPWGETASYGEIGRRVGAPRAARAVGGAVGRCPISTLIPCHRIIAADGTIGGYGGDGPADRDDALEHKRALLLREGITVGRRAT